MPEKKKDNRRFLKNGSGESNKAEAQSRGIAIFGPG
jgi:hypothetical protein